MNYSKPDPASATADEIRPRVPLGWTLFSPNDLDQFRNSMNEYTHPVYSEIEFFRLALARIAKDYACLRESSKFNQFFVEQGIVESFDRIQELVIELDNYIREALGIKPFIDPDEPGDIV